LIVKAIAKPLALTYRPIPRKGKREFIFILEAHMKDVKDLATRNSKRFSGSRKEDEIRTYVDENLIMGAELVLGLPISVLDLISEGGQHFRKSMVVLPSES
jgi:hypothetical protein